MGRNTLKLWKFLGVLLIICREEKERMFDKPRSKNWVAFSLPSNNREFPDYSASVRCWGGGGGGEWEIFNFW